MNAKCNTHYLPRQETVGDVLMVALARPAYDLEFVRLHHYLGMLRVPAVYAECSDGQETPSSERLGYYRVSCELNGETTVFYEVSGLGPAGGQIERGRQRSGFGTGSVVRSDPVSHHHMRLKLIFPEHLSLIHI